MKAELRGAVRLLLHIGKYPLAALLANTRFYIVCRKYADFFYVIPMLRRFRVKICNRQAPVQLYYYTPLVISEDRQNKQLTFLSQGKLALTAIKSLSEL
jgi:hypothetical protein